MDIKDLDLRLKGLKAKEFFDEVQILYKKQQILNQLNSQKATQMLLDNKGQALRELIGSVPELKKRLQTNPEDEEAKALLLIIEGAKSEDIEVKLQTSDAIIRLCNTNPKFKELFISFSTPDIDPEQEELKDQITRQINKQQQKLILFLANELNIDLNNLHHTEIDQILIKAIEVNQYKEVFFTETQQQGQTNPPMDTLMIA